jgi:hypothetical protein
MIFTISILLNIVLIYYFFIYSKSVEAKQDHVRFDIYSKNNKITDAQMSEEKTMIFPIEGKDSAVCYITSNRKEAGKIKLVVE